MRSITRCLPGIGLVLAVLLGMTGLVMTATAQDDATPAATPVATPAAGVIREVLNEGDPASAPGEVLQLVQYSIPGNIALPAHTHPGMQVNVVVSGTLTYTVVEGEAHVTRADGTEETLSDGDTTDLLPGDAITEPEGMVHFGVNNHDEPVVLLTASLFEEDAPPSSVVEASPAATAAATPAS